jgi:Peptidase family S41
MKKRIFSLAILLLLAIITNAQNRMGNIHYEFDKKYSATQLQADFRQFREILEKKHPRLYEYTSKKQLDKLFDSLYLRINASMTERQFQYFISPVISKVHCSHTKILPSRYLTEHINDYINAPCFKLFFDEGKAFFLNNYSSDTSIKIGAEVLSINGVTTEQIINNFAIRIHNEGKNITWIYNRLNAALLGLFPALCDYPNIETYTLTYKNPDTETIREISLKSIKQADYIKYNPAKPAQNYSFSMLDSLSTGILKVLSFKFPCDSPFNSFINKTFNELRSKHIKNLIVDVRGNIGGLPYPAAELLKHLSAEKFIYYKKTDGFTENWSMEDCKVFNNLISPSENLFKGKIYFLVDGGCRSTTGHFCALVKYHKIGTMIGEETCASFDCNSNAYPITLKYTKLILECATAKYEVAVKGLERGNGVMPDIYIRPITDNIINGKDTVLLYTLAKIGQISNKSSR